MLFSASLNGSQEDENGQSGTYYSWLFGLLLSYRKLHESDGGSLNVNNDHFL